MSLVGKTVVLAKVALWMNEKVGLDLMVDLKRNEKHGSIFCNKYNTIRSIR